MTDENRAESLVGKVKEKAGFAAGDREVEAAGKLDQLDAAGSGDEDETATAAQAVAEAEDEVRKDHGELQ
jgi:uncharacterized protein YjbJ (UPF0337 family)